MHDNPFVSFIVGEILAACDTQGLATGELIMGIRVLPVGLCKEKSPSRGHLF